MPPKRARRPSGEETPHESVSNGKKDTNSVAEYSVALNPAAIPEELRLIPRWVTWIWTPAKKPGGKPGKLLLDPKTGHAAKSNDPTTWGTFDEALAAMRERGHAGVAIALVGDDDIAGVDLDNCVDPVTGEIAPWAQAHVETLDSYTERSPSGTGLRIMLRGKLPPGRRKRGDVEMYEWGRFLTLTGATVDGRPGSLEQRTDELAKVHAEVFPPVRKERKGPQPRTDDDVLALAQKGASSPKFSALWSGDHSAYPSPSEADLALCGILGRLTHGDAGQVDRMFRRSGLFRPKWDERHGERTYGQITVAKAIRGARPPRTELEGSLSFDSRNGPVELRYRKKLAKPNTRVEVRLPGGTTFTDVLDLERETARARLVKNVAKRAPDVLVEDLEHALDQMAAELGDQATAEQPDDPDDWDDPDDSDPSSQDSGGIVSLAVGAPGVDLFHTPGEQDAEAYATITRDGKRETLAIKSLAFKFWIVGEYRRKYKAVPPSEDLSEGLLAITAEAIYGGPEHEIHVRCAEHQGSIWIDLCDKGRTAVQITATGWQVVASDKVPVRFVRRRGMRALPVPARGGNVEVLMDLANLADQAALVLLVCVLVAYLRPRGPYPILIVTGEQGSAKSYVCRIVRSLVDPNKVPLRRPPREDRDLLIAATNSWIVAFDNISSLSAWLSDTLCSLATRGGFSTRELYTDDEEKLFDAMRPVMLNGIGDIATRADLLDRAVILHQPVIPEGKRLPEKELDARFEREAPGLLGDLLDGVSAALRNEAQVQFTSLPRMADFALWATAAETAFGWDPGTFMAAHAGTQRDADTVSLEGSVLGLAVVEFLLEVKSWSGTASDLLARLESKLGETRTSKVKSWPKHPNQVKGQLDRIGPVLRRRGVIVSRDRESGSSRDRIIDLQLVEVGMESSESSGSSGNGPDGAAEGIPPGRSPDDSMFDGRPGQEAPGAGQDAARDDSDDPDDLDPPSESADDDSEAL